MNLNFSAPEIVKPKEISKHSKVSLLPRSLTEEEVDNIMDYIELNPDTRVNIGYPEIVDESVDLLRKYNIFKRLRRQLETVKCVTGESLNEIQEDLLLIIDKKYEESRLKESKTVGIRAAQSLSKGATQTNLNTFHFAGAKHIIRNIINQIKGMICSQSLPNEDRTMNIHFDKQYNLTTKDIFSFKGKFKQMLLSDYLDEDNPYLVLTNMKKYDSL